MISLAVLQSRINIGEENMLNQDAVKELSRRMDEPEWFLKKRLEAFEEYRAAPMPLFKYGAGIFMDARNPDIDKIKPLDENVLEVACSSRQVEILSFREAFRKHESILKKHFMSAPATQPDKINALNRAFLNHGMLILVPERVSAHVNIDSVLRSSSSLEHILVVAEPNSKATITESVRDKLGRKTTNAFRSQIVDIIGKENASIEYISAQNLGYSVDNFVKRSANIEKNGSMHWVDCCLGSRFTQSLTSTMLNGAGAAGRTLGLFLGDKEQKFDISAETVHNAPKTSCGMYTRGVLNDSAKNIWRGLIRIQPSAHGCNGYQKSDTLLLGDNAETDPIPVLEIYNDDVKCSHGATIGQINEEKIFYLMSRGLGRDNAIKTLIKGFFAPVVNKLDKRLRTQIKENVSKRIETSLSKDKEGVYNEF